MQCTYDVYAPKRTMQTWKLSCCSYRQLHRPSSAASLCLARRCGSRWKSVRTTFWSCRNEPLFFKGLTIQKKGPPSFWSIGDFYRLFIGIYVSCSNLNIRPLSEERSVFGWSFSEGIQIQWVWLVLTTIATATPPPPPPPPPPTTTTTTTAAAAAATPTTTVVFTHWKFHFEICMSPSIICRAGATHQMIRRELIGAKSIAISVEKKLHKVFCYNNHNRQPRGQSTSLLIPKR